MAKTRLKSRGPPQSTSKSKGKWLPGTVESGNGSACAGPEPNSLYCQCCNRSFLNESALEKHRSTELHFKRERKNEASKFSTLWLKPSSLTCRSPFEFDMLADGEVLPNQRSRRSVTLNKMGALNTSQEGGPDRVQCPTCFSSFDKKMMGKHLLSFFHCQKSENTDRSQDPEQSLILNNISSIVALAPYQCKPCRFYFNRHDQLIKHFEEVHIKNQKKISITHPWGWECSACRKRGVCASDMLQHLQVSQEHKKMQAAIQMSIPIIIKSIRLFICSPCKKNFTLRKAFLSHQKQFHPDMVVAKERLRNSNNLESTPEVIEPQAESETFSCNVCLKRFKNRAALMSHSRSAHEGKARFGCSSCDYTTNKKSHFQRHVKVHDRGRQRDVKCSLCDASFFEKAQLTFHMKLHEGKSVKCDYEGCDFLGRSQSEINSHRIKHDAKKQYKCVSCDYQTSSKPNIKRHMVIVHAPSEKEFQCTSCEYKSKTSYGLKRHELSHSDHRPYLCPFCDYRARSIENLRTHVVWRTMHKGKKLYNCSLCPEVTYRTNSFADFKAHVTKLHPTSRKLGTITETELFIIAQIRKSDSKDYSVSEPLEENTDSPMLPGSELESDALLDLPLPVHSCKPDDSELAAILKNLMQEEVFDKLGSSLIMNPVDYL